MQIRDSRMGTLAKKEGMTHQTKASFTTEVAENYELCIISHVSPGKKMTFVCAHWKEQKKIIITSIN